MIWMMLAFCLQPSCILCALLDSMENPSLRSSVIQHVLSSLKWQCGSSGKWKFCSSSFFLNSLNLCQNVLFLLFVLIGRQRMRWSVHSYSLIKLCGLEELESTRYGISVAITPLEISNFSIWLCKYGVAYKLEIDLPEWGAVGAYI